MQSSIKIGLECLLHLEKSTVVLIDHQQYLFTNVNSHEPAMIINNTIAINKTAKVFSLPTILNTFIEERGGYIINLLNHL